MKRTQNLGAWLLGILATVGVSCNNLTDEESLNPSDENVRSICFNTGLEITDLSASVEHWQRPALSAVQTDAVRGGNSRAPLADVAKKIHFYDIMGPRMVQTLTQETTGSFHADLLYGVHALRFMAHNGAEEAPKDGLLFTAQKVTDSFLANVQLEVSADTPTDQVIQMKRVVGKVKVMILDAIPKEVKKLRMTLDSHCLQLDMQTGFGVTETMAAHQREWTLQPSQIGQTNNNTTIYTFVPEGGLTTKVTIEALGDGDVVLFKRVASSVPVEVNRCTTARCELFSQGEAFTFNVSDEWDADLEIDM